MTLDFSIRYLHDQDGDSVADLLRSSPDAGKFAIAAHYQIDPYHALTCLQPNNVGFVAKAAQVVLGMGMVRLETYQLDGRLRPSAVLNTLVVHPSYRGHGIATALTAERLAYARQEIGEDGLLLAGVQRGNAPSMAVVRKWQHTIVGPLRRFLIPVSDKQPPVDADFAVQEAQASDFDAIAICLNAFYKEYNLYQPQTAVAIAHWLRQSPFNLPIRRYFVVKDKQGNLLAGAGITDQHRITAMYVEHMPGVVRVLNRFVKMVPADGLLRQLAVNHAWFHDEHERAGRLLWDYLRWLSRDWGTHLTFSYDPRGPFPKILRLPKWLPQSSSYIAVSEPLHDSTKLFYAF